ncbi:transposase [Streptomyces sp. NPDC050529]|uniref:transposase n=1 Tax=Streptomyces sp. NPDC050529 TaxID=3365624 RepID=UPI0037A27870
MLPPFATRPQGGGTAPCDERDAFTPGLYALTNDCAWRYLPPLFGTSPATAHRRFTAWTEAALWHRLPGAVLDIDPRRSAARYPLREAALPVRTATASVAARRGDADTHGHRQIRAGHVPAGGCRHPARAASPDTRLVGSTATPSPMHSLPLEASGAHSGLPRSASVDVSYGRHGVA